MLSFVAGNRPRKVYLDGELQITRQSVSDSVGNKGVPPLPTPPRAVAMVP